MIGISHVAENAWRRRRLANVDRRTAEVTDAVVVYGGVAIGGVDQVAVAATPVIGSDNR